VVNVVGLNVGGSGRNQDGGVMDEVAVVQGEGKRDAVNSP